MRENNTVLIVAKNNAIRTNYVKAPIRNKQENKRCKLSEEREVTVNHIIRKYNNLTEKMYKNKHE